MPKIKYINRRFKPRALAIIAKANEIIEEYQEQGFELTLRQLYYQFVSRDLIANNMREYKNLGSVINDGRLAGLIDWDAIVDRTRNLQSISHWDSPKDIVKAAASSYHIDKWATQKARVEVWIEKDALVGVIEGVCQRNDVPFFSCRGYTSQSELWGAAQRFNKYHEANQSVVILHFGDHDPSGIDMTRDIQERLTLFSDYRSNMRDGCPVHVVRLALETEQVKRFKLPPNPAKMTDSRARGYVEEHGTKSWELDALEPKYIATLIQDGIEQVRDEKKWAAAVAREEKERGKLAGLLKHL